MTKTLELLEQREKFPLALFLTNLRPMHLWSTSIAGQAEVKNPRA